MAAKNIVGKWQHGYVVLNSDGEKTYYVRKKINGRPYDFSTRAGTLKAALKQYDRFITNPAAYTPSGEALPVSEGGLPLTTDLIETHIADAEAAGVSHKWQLRKRAYLTDLKEALGNRDLRCLELLDLQNALEGLKPRAHRVAVVKAFFWWARAKGLVSRRDDPSLDLKAPPQRSAASQGKKRAVTLAEFEATFAKMEQYRDVMTVLHGSAAHLEEVLRLANGEGEIGTNTITWSHKLGDFHVQVVEPYVIEAAKRLKPFSISRLWREVKRAADAAGVRHWSPGAMRHSVLSWKQAAGASRKDLSSWVGHRSPVTIRKYTAFTPVALPETKKAIPPPKHLVPVA